MTEFLALGKPLALAFVDPQCGPCAALLPELACWVAELADQVTLVVITAGTIEANNRNLGGHDLGHVLVQKGREVSEAYRAHGTPSMVLVEPGGMISSPVTPGRDAIRGLMARFTVGQRQPGDSATRAGPAVQNGGSGAQGGGKTGVQTRIGYPAPDLRLPDLDGRQVSLAAFGGYPTLVLFWNPACGFCQSMLGDLKVWETSRSDTSPQLLVVSAGSVEANKAMGLRGPVTLDAGFGSGRAFGAAGTPAAVLVDRDGRIASEVAVGAPAVLALAAGQAMALGTGV
jgi:thiol-disulfide isomerase/thioredoxin